MAGLSYGVNPGRSGKTGRGQVFEDNKLKVDKRNDIVNNE
jgi:hypothetical protein